jgi:transposase
MTGCQAVTAHVSINIRTLRVEERELCVGGGKVRRTDELTAGSWALVCSNYLTFITPCAIGSSMSTPTKRKALGDSGTLNPHPEAVHSELFHMEFFDPYDFAQVKYEMLRAHSVDEDPVAEVCRQFGLSRESFYQIQQAFRELGFSSFLPRKRGRKGPVKLKGEVLEFALAQQKEQPDMDPGRLADLIQERYGIALHRTTVLRGLKKKLRSATEGTRTSRRRVPRERRPRAEDL